MTVAILMTLLVAAASWLWWRLSGTQRENAALQAEVARLRRHSRDRRS